MKPRSLVSAVLSLVAVAALVVACESEEATDNLQITPAYKEIRPGSSVVLTASGADRYTWNVDDVTLGGLSATKGATVVYTAPSQLSGNATQIVTVTGTFGGASISTNSSSAVTAQATISIVPKQAN